MRVVGHEPALFEAQGVSLSESKRVPSRCATLSSGNFREGTAMHPEESDASNAEQERAWIALLEEARRGLEDVRAERVEPAREAIARYRDAHRK